MGGVSEVMRRKIAVRMSFVCFILRPCWVEFFWVIFWPHSGQVFAWFFCVFRLLSEYLHFLQWMCVEVCFPIRPLMRREIAVMAVIVRKAMVSVGDILLLIYARYRIVCLWYSYGCVVVAEIGCVLLFFCMGVL